MAEFKTPVKKSKALDTNAEKITIPPSPFLNRLGYGTGVSVMQLVRSPRAGQLRSPWALKMINRRVKPNPVFADRLQEEAALLKRMSHPNIVGFRAFDNTKMLYLGMEACDVSLGDMIEKRAEEGLEPYAPKQILKVAADIASALDYLHTEMRILHGDMKSYNILVNGDFVTSKLCDFGVTLPLDESGALDKTAAVNTVYFGTEAWSAPEVLLGEDISDRTDVWPLGLVLWEMLALMPPHSQADGSGTLDGSASLDDEESFQEYFSERYGEFRYGRMLYLGMEACDVSLGDMIEKRAEEGLEPYAPKQILKVAADIASALDYLHTEMRILHGDMKSYNILVNGDFVTSKLCDFGVTLPLDESGALDKTAAVNTVYFGTEAWSAPEVLLGEDISDRTDVWPLGLVLWEMLALMPPHSQADGSGTLDGSASLDDEESFQEYFSERYGTRPPLPAGIPEDRYAEPLALFHCCTLRAPAARPAARHLAAAAADMLRQ